MTAEKLLSVIQKYRSEFERAKIPKDKWPKLDHGLPFIPEGHIWAHCHYMLDQMEEFVRQGRMEKAFRWLGFVQGCLFATGRKTIAELKDDSRPETAG